MAAAHQERPRGHEGLGGARPLFVQEVRAANPGKEVEVWFEDEARIGQQGTLTTIWAPKGSRPTAVKQTDYEWVHLTAAVNPLTGDAIGIITPDMNTLVMNDLLLNISIQLGQTRHAVLVWDGAGYHGSGTLEVPANITLLPLPPYSPELNCVERVWLWMRAHDLSNRAYTDQAHIEQAVNESCGRLDRERLKTICRTPWLERKD
jgi:transposase